jgi:hypothetical protein
VPVVVFANGSGPQLREWNGYMDWARLVTSRGLAGVLYEGPSFDPSKTLAQNVATSMADLDSVLSRLTTASRDLGIDASNVVIWAGSAQTYTGTPVALNGNRTAVKGYVLYYGSGDAEHPRLDVPVLVARAGLDSPQLNQMLDSLVSKLTDAGVPLTVVTYPGGRHGFDIADSTAMTARVIAQTLDFMVAATDPVLRSSIVLATPEVRASAAFVGGRWNEAAQLYEELARSRPTSPSVAWRLGLSQLEAGKYANALDAFERARELGVTGARDIGIPAARAGLRGGQTEKAAEWVVWALSRFPPIRGIIAADKELAPLLEHPLVKRIANSDRRPATGD